MTNTIKKETYDLVSRITKAISSPNRLEIIDILSQGEKAVEAISEQTGLGVKNTSAQLKELKTALLVSSRKDGKFVYYRLADEAVSELWLSIRKFSEAHLLELQKIASELIHGSQDLTVLDRKELLSKAKHGKIVILDVRPGDEYEAAHLPYAVSIPMSDLKKHIQKLPKDREIVAYCRGPYCVWAKEAAELLRSEGFQASHLRDGVCEWSAVGLPVKTSRAG